jgi:hypothetical protein
LPLLVSAMVVAQVNVTRATLEVSTFYKTYGRLIVLCDENGFLDRDAKILGDFQEKTQLTTGRIYCD